MSMNNANDNPGETRRSFVRAGSAALAGIGIAGAYAKETLALSGGPKTVTFPAAQQTALSKWPRYGAAEKKALHDLIDSSRFYEELPAFEKEWKDYTASPFVK